MADKVIFRIYKDSDVIALFPEIPGTAQSYTCQCYQHFGQHGSADLAGVIQVTKAASPAEYADLKRELENLSPEPYKLEVIKRTTRGHYLTRKAELDRMRGPKSEVQNA